LRSRLVDRVVAARTAVIVAPSGYGKSTLVDDAAAALGLSSVRVEITPTSGASADLLLAAVRRALRAGGLRSLADALEVGPREASALLVELLSERGDDPVIFDDVQNLAATAAQLVGEIARHVAEPHRVIIAGHSLPPGAVSNPDVMVNAGDLAFTADEIRAEAKRMRRPVEAFEADAIASATGGWPAAVHLAIETSTTDVRSLRVGLTELLDRLLASVDPQTRVLAGWAAHVPWLSDSVAAALGNSDAIERLVSTGLPLRRRADGWVVMPDPLREVLRSTTSLPP